MKPSPSIITAAAVLSLGLAACDSQAENEIEQTAEAVDESYEAEADLIESMEAGAPEDYTSDQADALRARGEEIKDELEDAADQMDRTPQ
jgi:uncharacterized lipoprotein